jgi:hypothetical protein
VIEHIVDGDQRHQRALRNIGDFRQPPRIVASIEKTAREPHRTARGGALQPLEHLHKRLRIHFRRRHQNKIEPLDEVQQIRQAKKALPFFCATLSERQQTR